MRSIVVVGSGYSGSGAIFDYLAGRGDVEQAFAGTEFRLVHDPGGLNDLEHAVVEDFTPNRANAAVHRFRALARSFARDPGAHPPGYGLRRACPGFLEAVDAFLDQITAVSYSGTPRAELASSGPVRSRWERGRRWLAWKRGTIARSGTMVLPVQREKYRRHQEGFIQDLARRTAGTGADFVVWNQAGSFWRPVSSTRCFKDRRIVVVSRDPMDIYCDLQKGGYAYPGDDVESFCTWYRDVMERIDRQEWRSKEVCHVRFEGFVQAYEQAREDLDHWLGLDPEVRSTYDPEGSLKNIGIGKHLPKETQKRIRELLGDRMDREEHVQPVEQVIDPRR